MDDYTAWLIEINEPYGPVYFRYGFDDNDWTSDHDDALHLARKKDAEAIIEAHGWTEAKPVEHMWPALTQRDCK